MELRVLECREVTPAQVGFTGTRLVARLETRVRRHGVWKREVVYLVSSLSLAELQARGLLRRKRQYWIIESRLHHCLDITLHEDQSRVRTPNAAHLLGTLRRLVVSLANVAVNRARSHNPKSKFNTRRFQQAFRVASLGPKRLHALIHSKSPRFCDF